jgi:hypothetical protein
MGTDKIPLGNINIPSSGGGTVTSEIDFREDPTPAIAAGILGNSAKPAVYVAYEVGSGPFAIDIQGGRDPVAGTISIDANGVSLSGNFSSRLCSVAACG